MVFSWHPAVLRLAEVPVVPGADEARRWAQEELARKIYQDAKPGWSEKIFGLLKKALGELLGKLGVAEPNIGLAVLVGLLIVAVIAIVLIVRPKLNRRNTKDRGVFATELALTSAQHRALAKSAARDGDFRTAIGEMFRAIARSAEERDISIPAPGRTATEIVNDLERAFPGHRRELARSAELFNAVRYGELHATAAMYQEMVAVDAALTATKPHYAHDLTAVEP